MRVLPSLVAVVLVSCGDTSSPGFSSEPGITSVAGSTGASSTGASTSAEPADDSAGSAGSSTTGILRDVGSSIDFGPVQPPGCKGKVDVLFVISRLGSESSSTALRGAVGGPSCGRGRGPPTGP